MGKLRERGGSEKVEEDSEDGKCEWVGVDTTSSISSKLANEEVEIAQ